MSNQTGEFKDRLRKAGELRDMGMNPYPSRFPGKHSIADVLQMAAKEAIGFRKNHWTKKRQEAKEAGDSSRSSYDNSKSRETVIRQFERFYRNDSDLFYAGCAWQRKI